MENCDGSGKKRKSGHELRREKEIRQRNEAAQSCAKISDLFHKPATKSSDLSVTPCAGLGKFNTDKSNQEVRDRIAQETEKISEDMAQAQDGVLPMNVDTPPDNYGSNSLPASAVFDEISDVEDFFQKPAQNRLERFFSFHPVQPVRSKDGSPLPFDNNVFQVQRDGENFKRNWLTYSEKNHKLYCSVCLAFSSGSSQFFQGFDRYRHLLQTVGEHEKSKAHEQSVNSYIKLNEGRTVTMLFEKQLDKQKKIIMQRRKIVSGVIDVVKLIGKQGLAFRGKDEGAYSLDDPLANHGNFLEIFLLLSKYDPNLAKHVENVIDASKARKITGKTGRGSHVTFLSKTTVTNIINIIKRLIRTEIATEINKSKYSVMMDTTTDVSGYDQCAIVLRYVLGIEVRERVVGLESVESTTGESLFNTLLEVLKKLGIPVENCIADAFDGASNMNGAYKGVSSRLQSLIPNHIHTWCYAHVLNLVQSDTAQCLPATISFFGLLQQTQVFIKDSHKRLAVYLNQNPKVRLSAIGATRWRSRSDATNNIFGRYNDWFRANIADDNDQQKDTSQSQAVYVELIATLCLITTSTDFNPKTRSDANSLLQKYLSFESILVAMMFLAVFKITTPLSDYLQTKDLDYAQAWRLIENAMERLAGLRNKFEDVVTAAGRFVTSMSAKLEKKLEENPRLDEAGAVIESELPTKRRKKDDQQNLSAQDLFRINVFHVVVDRVNQAMQTRFAEHKKLYLDLSYFDPRRFPEMNDGQLPVNALEKITDLLPNVNKGKLIEELESFAQNWPRLVSSMKNDYKCPEPEVELEFDIGEGEEEDNTVDGKSDKVCETKKQPCKSCIKCAFKIIFDYNMYSIMYTELAKVYKFLLTIPLTQVTCERAFSSLKFLKSRLRANITNENLESLLLMHSEKDMLIKISNDAIIEGICEASSEMTRLLSL